MNDWMCILFDVIGNLFAVNNVGQMYEHPETLASVPEDVIWSMILTNIAAATMMTRLLVNDMKQRQKGIIVNVASGTALQPAPYAAVYAASKVCLIDVYSR